MLNSPTPVQCAFVAYTPAGQKYTVNLMEGRPKKFKVRKNICSKFKY